MSETPERPPPGGGKKIMGLPRNAVIIGGVTLVLALAYFMWKRRQSGSSTSSTADGTGTDYSGEISTLQSEYGDLANELAAMQGSGGGSSGSAGGGTPPVIVGNGPTGTTGTTDTSGTPADGSTNQAKGTAPAPKPRTKKPGPRPRGPAERDRHEDHMQHLAHERHLANQGRRRTGP